MTQRRAARICALNRLDGLFFAVVSPEGRLVNVILAHGPEDAARICQDIYGLPRADALALRPAELTWTDA